MPAGSQYYQKQVGRLGQQAAAILAERRSATRIAESIADNDIQVDYYTT